MSGKIVSSAAMVGAVVVLSFATLATAASATGQGPVGGVPIFGAPKPGSPDFNGKWINLAPMIGLRTVAGGAPPLNAAGRAAYAKHKSDPKSDPINLCQMQGVPRLLYTSHPFVILHYVTHVDFVHEVNHTFRIVKFGVKLDPDADPLWLGHPTARLEGKTLVIDSGAYNDKTWLDYKGLPHSAKLKTQERYSLSADGKSISGQVAIDDPVYYSQPWTTAFTLKKLPGFSLREYSCIADHRM